MAEPSDSNEKLTDTTIEAIGLAVVGWSGLEYSVALLAKNLLTLNGLPTSTADTLVHNLDLRARADIALPLVYILLGNRPLTQRIQTSLNAITVELRGQRNRIIHDSWQIGENAIRRLDTRAIRIVKPQAIQMQLAEPATNELPLPEIIAFSRKCADEQMRLNALSEELWNLANDGEIQILSSKPTRRLRLKNNRLLRRIGAMFGRPPRSSRA